MTASQYPNATRPRPRHAASAALAITAAAAAASVTSAEQQTVTLTSANAATPFPTNTATTTYAVHIDGGDPAETTIRLPGTASPTSVTIDALTIDAGDTLWLNQPATLDILDRLTLNGSLMTTVSGKVRLPMGHGLAGDGEFRGYSGTVENAGGPFTIEPGIHVLGGILTLKSPDGPIVNHGRITAGPSVWNPGSVWLHGTSLANTGVIEAVDNGRVIFDLPFQQISDLGNLSHATGGRFGIGNTLDNTGRTFTTNAQTGHWELYGTIRGGRLSSADGRALIAALGTESALDNVTLDGDIYVWGDLRFDNMPQVNGSGTIRINSHNRAYSTAPALVIGPQLTVIGSNDWLLLSDEGLGDATRPTINKGRLVAEKVLQVNGASFVNEGHLRIEPGGVLAINAPFKLSDLGGTIDNRGAIRILGTLDNTGQTFTTPNALGKWELDGTIRGGTIETSGSAPLIVRSNRAARTVTLDGVRLNGILLAPDLNGTIRIPAGQALTGSGQVQFSSDSTRLRGDDGLTIARGMTVSASAGTVGDRLLPLVNDGMIESWALRNMTIAGSRISTRGTLRTTESSHMYADTPRLIFEDGGAFASVVAPREHVPAKTPLVVTGDLDLSASDDYLHLTLGPAATLGKPYELARYGGALTGAFDNVTPGFAVDYSTPGVIFVSAVPEPAAGLIFAPGAATLLHRRRRSTAIK